MSNPFANKLAAQNALASILTFKSSTNNQIVENAVSVFLDALNSSDKYNTMSAALVDSITGAGAVEGSTRGLRILVSIDDGTVAYDSSKPTNTWAAFTNDDINSSNHNTRPEILLATLSSSGTGVSRRFSTTLGKYLYYAAARAGVSAEQNAGTIRVSFPESSA